jgi:hypothetical protein
MPQGNLVTLVTWELQKKKKKKMPQGNLVTLVTWELGHTRLGSDLPWAKFALAQLLTDLIKG